MPVIPCGAIEMGGYNLITVRWANWLLTIGTALLMMGLTQKVTKDWVTSLVATVLFLLYPSTLLSEARGGVEILFIPVVLIFMLLLHQVVTKEDSWRYLVAGHAKWRSRFRCGPRRGC